jgi:tripartite-type tricarboxylate transporter receptor subunit TctC
MLLMEIPMTNSMRIWKRVAKTVIAVILPAGAAIGVALLTADAASGQTYPSKLVKVICPLPSGSVIDVMARLVTSVLSSQLGKPAIVENRPGGGGTIGAKEVARAAPDGHTLLIASVNLLFVSNTLDYDPVKDFAPIGTVATYPWILVVSPAVQARSVQELIDHAKANPGKLNWGVSLGSGPHLFGEMFKIATGIDVSVIPYKSGTQAVPDMLGGRIDMNFGTVSNLLPLIRAGKLRALAITSETRSQDLPDVPTMAESGFPRLTRGSWTALWAPAGTPVNIVSRLNAEINAGMTTPAMKAALKKLDFEPKVGSPQEFAAFIVDEVDAWTPAAKAAGILPE